MELKRRLRKLRQRGEIYVLDAVDSILARRPALVPPRWLNHNGTSFAAADEIVDLVRSYTEFKPNAAILDLGCGIGRVAFSLTKTLAPDGRYVGIDIVEPAINWMKAEYGPRHPNFTFHHLDVHNSAYNPTGKKMTDEIDFGFLGDQKFDVVVLVSVFTHLYPHHIRHYLKLIRGILKPEGRVFSSMFINDDFAKEQYRLGKETKQKLTSRNFRVEGDGFYAAKDGNPEFVVAYDPAQIDTMWADTGLKIEQPFRYGAWCGRPGGHNFYQDVVISQLA